MLREGGALLHGLTPSHARSVLLNSQPDADKRHRLPSVQYLFSYFRSLAPSSTGLMHLSIRFPADDSLSALSWPSSSSLSQHSDRQRATARVPMGWHITQWSAKVQETRLELGPPELHHELCGSQSAD